MKKITQNNKNYYLVEGRFDTGELDQHLFKHLDEFQILLATPDFSKYSQKDIEELFYQLLKYECTWIHLYGKNSQLYEDILDEIIVQKNIEDNIQSNITTVSHDDISDEDNLELFLSLDFSENIIITDDYTIQEIILL